MRVPMTFKFIVRATLLLLSASSMIVALVRLPLLVLDMKTGLFFLLGALPVFVLRSSDRKKYIYAIVFMAGVMGLLLFARDYLRCFIEAEQSCTKVFDVNFFIVTIIYLSFLVISLFSGQIFLKKEKKSLSS